MKLMCCGRNAARITSTASSASKSAGKNVDRGVAREIAEMAGNSRGLDQLHKGISGRLGQMFGEMLEQRRPIRLHADSLDKGFDEAGNVLCALLKVAIADMSMNKCLPHIARSLMISASTQD